MAGAALQSIGAAAARQRIPMGGAEQMFDAAELVAARPTGVLQRCQGQAHRHRGAGARIAGRVSADMVATDEGVVAAAAIERVVAIPSFQAVGAVIPEQAIVAAASEQMLDALQAVEAGAAVLGPLQAEIHLHGRAGSGP